MKANKRDRQKAEELIKKLRYPIGVPYEFRFKRGRKEVVYYFMSRIASDFASHPLVCWKSNPGSATANVVKQFFDSNLRPLPNDRARQTKGEMMEELQCNIVGLYKNYARPVTDVAKLAELVLCGLEVDAAEIQKQRIREAILRLDKVQGADELEQVADAIERAVRNVL